MPGIVLLGSRYFQEVAPDVALDRTEIVSMNSVINTPAGKFVNSLQVKETTPMEPTAVEYKFYAAGIGLVKDDTLNLVKYGYIR